MLGHGLCLCVLEIKSVCDRSHVCLCEDPAALVSMTLKAGGLNIYTSPRCADALCLRGEYQEKPSCLMLFTSLVCVHVREEESVRMRQCFGQRILSRGKMSFACVHVRLCVTVEKGESFVCKFKFNLNYIECLNLYYNEYWISSNVGLHRKCTFIT